MLDQSSTSTQDPASSSRVRLRRKSSKDRAALKAIAAINQKVGATVIQPRVARNLETEWRELAAQLLIAIGNEIRKPLPNQLAERQRLQTIAQFLQAMSDQYRVQDSFNLSQDLSEKEPQLNEALVLRLLNEYGLERSKGIEHSCIPNSFVTSLCSALICNSLML